MDRHPRKSQHPKHCDINNKDGDISLNVNHVNKTCFSYIDDCFSFMPVLLTSVRSWLVAVGEFISSFFVEEANDKKERKTTVSDRRIAKSPDVTLRMTKVKEYINRNVTLRRNVMIKKYKNMIKRNMIQI